MTFISEWFSGRCGENSVWSKVLDTLKESTLFPFISQPENIDTNCCHAHTWHLDMMWLGILKRLSGKRGFKKMLRTLGSVKNRPTSITWVWLLVFVECESVTRSRVRDLHSLPALFITGWLKEGPEEISWQADSSSSKADCLGLNISSH
jgi:hypothetical protein